MQDPGARLRTRAFLEGARRPLQVGEPGRGMAWELCLQKVHLAVVCESVWWQSGHLEL